MLPQFQHWVNENQWNLILAPNLNKRFHQLGGTEYERISDIQWALNNPDVKAVFVARGGYGTLRLFHYLEALDFGQMPKWWVGFSDLTVLHAVLAKQRLASIHGPMAMQFAQSNPYLNQNANSLLQALTGIKQSYPIDQKPNTQFEGILLGGNLSMIYTLAAAGKLPDLNGKVLFIEDIDEYVEPARESVDFELDRAARLVILVGSVASIHRDGERDKVDVPTDTDFDGPQVST
jgi:muramoyltetrapeptide carboxypeptidase